MSRRYPVADEEVVHRPCASKAPLMASESGCISRPHRESVHWHESMFRYWHPS
ncbi:uncharacterized protein B0H18DRAFT_1052047 [Fomitopsis serialis]|uniref:uncharacterized protein n=1 Tax=Fomitopsis serialis TaxID=139415 RepID=UPI002007843B|nr:uncharacterized protein B0H18DRAFT_1052047 [Neoantrodia serialis]KAH9912742.1 hypothetical protein B0H18DRAFT_1052047 [Neoantrodia serialis]